MNPDKLALKRDTQALLRSVGGLEAAAAYCRVGKSVLSDNASPNKPDSFIALDVLADLEPLARGTDGWPVVTRALALRQGFVLVKLPDALPSGSDLLRMMAEQSTQSGAVAASVCEALAEGKVTPGAARAVRALLARQIELAVQMDAACAAVAEG